MPNNSSARNRNALATVLGLLGMSGIAGVLVAALMTPLIAVVGVAANSTITLFDSLPDYLDIQPLQQKTELYGDLNGQRVKFAEFYQQNRIEVPLDQVSDYVKKAAISTEDPRFYQHGGVDIISAARAAVTSIVGSDAGASTITMQYVRNQRVQAAEAIQDPEAREKAYEEATGRSMGRKLQEMRLAIGVEQQFSKDEILQGYLNIALFGGDIYGIESAARYYFGKSAKDVTLAEAATLVGTVQNPNAFSIDDPDHIPAATNRRNYVLGRMLDEKAITKAEYDEALATKIEPKITPSQQGCMNAQYNTGFFCDYVRRVIENDPAFGATPEERSFNFRTKGYQIDTTIDLALQQTETDAIAAYIPKYRDDVNIGAAAVAVQPGTGYILAMQQNKDFDETKDAPNTATSVNYNTDYDYGGSSGFQVGSTYKVFTLANWLQSGHSLYEVVNAREHAYNVANFKNSCVAPGGGSWFVHNDEGNVYGNINAITATTFSVNAGFVSMGEKLDQCVTRDLAIAFGAHRADGKMNDSYPAAILGTNEIAPLSMASAFAGIANDGKACTPIAIKSMTLRDGTKVDPPQSECTQVVSPDIAHGMAFAMRQVMVRGSGTQSNPGLGDIIGKTGTTDDSFDTWMIGASTGFTAAVWLGNSSAWCPPGYTDASQCHRIPMRSLGLGQTRHQIAKPIFAAGLEKYGAKQIPDPSPDLMRQPTASVPDVAGMSVSAATAALEAAGFSVSVGDPQDSNQPAGAVASTIPSANTRVSQGASVTIHPSTGRAAPQQQQPDQQQQGQQGVAMPNLGGMSHDDAVAALTAAGLGNQGNRFEWHGPADGHVNATSPGPGQPVAPNTTVVIQAG